jgi:hypothetical protein
MLMVLKLFLFASNIGSLLTARGLAYWFQDDGSADRSGYYLYTNSFSYDDVNLLVTVLKNNFDLNCSIHVRKTKITIQHLIYIKGDSAEKFANLVRPFIVPSMMYKLQLRGSYKRNEL